MSQGISHLSAGDTLYVRGGVYSQTISCSRSGTSSSPITISGYPGENAVLEGNYGLGDMITVSGSYVTVQNLTAQRGSGAGAYLIGPYGQLLNVTTRSNMQSGIYVSGNGHHCVVSNCDVYYNSMRNFQYTNSGWGTGLSAANGGLYATLVGNRVYNNWGEGLSTFGCSNTTLIANTVWDNKVNVYLSDCKYCVLSNNLIYSSPNNVFSNGPNQIGIYLADETQIPPSSDNTIVNNLVQGCYNNFACWSVNLVRDKIAFNTFADAQNHGASANFLIGSAISIVNSVVEDNIVSQSNLAQSSIAYGGVSLSGVTFSHNLWSTTPPTAFRATGDVIADPLLVKSGSTSAGQLSPNWFTLQSGSPAIGAGVAVSGFTKDYFGATRPNPPGTGAVEYGSSLGSRPSPPDDLHVVSNP